MATTVEELWANFWTWTESHATGAYLFRGQADTSAILPKIGRSGYNFDYARERALFEAFERAARPYLKSEMSAFELLALAQHHGAPTRLVDWSTSPLVAAWFAVSSFPETTDAQIYALDVVRPDILVLDTKTGETRDGTTVKGPLSPRSGVYLIETAQVSNRITTQRGIFTLHGEPLTPFVVPSAETFEIPCALRAGFQSRLMDVGVDASHIYPDIDGLCRSLDYRFKSGKTLSAFA
ncbi:FRG domain-containing protein [Brevundimonas sp.]|uniref:FRG domain-containing protein n=1 Tax=Brevundimonas sp. TaxID=1871086 RepID=UPI003F7203CF